MKLAVFLGAAAVATVSAATGGPMYELRGVDVVDKDLKTISTGNAYLCLMECVKNASCGAISWTDLNGGTCYFKNTGHKGTPTTPKVEVNSYLILSDTSAEYVWSETKEGYDMAGYDLTNTRRANMGLCMTDCNAHSECYAVSWSNYNGGTCWLKSRASGYLAKAGVKVAYVARSGVTPW